jgi:hypothetical protein
VIARRIVIGIAVAMLGLGLFASDGLAKKKCKKLCKTNISDCRAGCTQTTKKEKRQCKKACRKDTLGACKTFEPEDQCVAPGSPSGAFLD